MRCLNVTAMQKLIFMQKNKNKKMLECINVRRILLSINLKFIQKITDISKSLYSNQGRPQKFYEGGAKFFFNHTQVEKLFIFHDRP